MLICAANHIDHQCSQIESTCCVMVFKVINSTSERGVRVIRCRRTKWYGS